MIRRVIQLLLDKAAARRVEQETKQSLDRGTDPKNAKKNLGVIGRAMNGLKASALALGGVLAAAFGIRAIVRFGKESVRAAAESEAIWNRLAGQLDSVGVKFGDVEGEVRATARALQDATTVGDEDFAQVLTELVGITGNYSASLAEVETVANLAAAKQIDLRTAAQLVGRVMVGETGTLSRYGIVVQEGADAMEVLRARFAGMAENEGRTLEGRLTMLSNEWGDLKQAIGDAMIAAGGGTSVLDTLIGTVKGLTVWVTENREGIAAWGTVAVRTLRGVAETARFLARILINSFDVVGSSIALAFLHIRQGFSGLVNFVIEGLNKLPGVDIEFRMNEMSPQEFAAAQRALVDDISGDARDMADALGDVAESYRDIGRAAVEAATGQHQAAAVPPPRPPSSSLTGSGEGEDSEEDEGRFRRLLERTAAAREAARQYREEELEKLREKAGQVADGMTAAFEGFFSASASGFEAQGGLFAAAGEAARGAGAAIVSGLTQGRAEAEMAEGTAALAAGLWPPNPAALLSAGKHFLAATLFRAIPGVIRGGGGGGIGAGGIGGGTLPRGALGSSSPSTRDLPGSEVHIYMDPLSPADPRFQRVALGAVQQATDRFGDNVKVHVHPRGGA